MAERHVGSSINSVQGSDQRKTAMHLSQLVRRSRLFDALFLLALSSAMGAQVGTVQSEQKISETTGGFGGVLDPGDIFGTSASSRRDRRPRRRRPRR
jgi:hypothetical protein